MIIENQSPLSTPRKQDSRRRLKLNPNMIQTFLGSILVAVPSIMLIRFFWLEAFSPYALISPERFNPMRSFPLKELLVANTVAFFGSICTRFSHLLAFLILFVVCYPMFATAHSGSGSLEQLAFLHSIHSDESAALKATYLAQFSFLVYRLIKMHQFQKLRE